MEADVLAGLDLLLDAHSEPSASGMRRSVFMPAQTIRAAAERLLQAGYHLEDISGLDCAEAILVNYHFNHYEHADRIVLRVAALHENGKVPSIASIFGGAEWHERELNDFFGVTFEGNPNPVALLLQEDDKSAPLRKTPRTRRPVRELINPGVIGFQAPDFDWFRVDGRSSATDSSAEGPERDTTVNQSGDEP